MAARLSSLLLASANPVKLNRLKMLQKASHKQRCGSFKRSSSGAAETSSPAAQAVGGVKSGKAGNESNGATYFTPSQDIVDIVDVPSVPLLSLSPDRKLILQSIRPSPMPPISELARPEVKLAACFAKDEVCAINIGLRLDTAALSRSRRSYYTGLALVDSTEVVPAEEGVQRAITGIPEGMWINSVSFSENGKTIAFTIRSPGGPNDPVRGPSELWVADVATCEARPISSTPYPLNTIFQEYTWLDEDTIVIFTASDSKEYPKQPVAPSGPTIQDNSLGAQVQSVTFQDLLKNSYDEDLFEYLSTTEVVLLDVNTGKECARGPPRMYTGASGSPDGQYLIVSWMERPFSYQVPCGRFPKHIEVWDRNFKCVREVAYLPLAEDIPVTFNSCRTGPRSVRWRPDKDAELVWIEAQDGGDAGVDVSPRDIVYTFDIPSAKSDAKPEVLSTTDLRCGGVSFCDGDLALLYQSWWKTRRSIVSVIAPDRRDEEPKVLFDRSFEDVYNDPGYPMKRRTSRGTSILAKVNGERKLLLQGTGASERGNEPFLDLLDVDTMETKRLWQSSPPHYEHIESLMSDVDDQIIKLEGLEVLMSRESIHEVPQYVLKTFSDNGAESKERVMTNFPHPYPQLKNLEKEIIRYERSDGVKLTATLYLPVGYDKERDGQLPCILWAYPREFKSKDAAGQLRRSPYEFVSIGATSPMVMLAKGYAILDGPTMPIIAEGDAEPNDTFVEQLKASAEAAVNAVVDRGVVDRKKIAVGGHSYGAFMAANLAAHCPELFACGIARSGAYNRTLTPFSFQEEQRTLWKAKDTYMTMSPFMMADKIKIPMLLIHGAEDNNPGTYSMQSERFYQALKGHGVQSRLVLLPHESHGYRAYESILHNLYEMERWLDSYCCPLTQ